MARPAKERLWHEGRDAARHRQPQSAAEAREAVDERQAGDTLTEKPHGTGLGLPISRHIVERHGGQIWVENHPGPGACFSFKLPVLKLAEAA